MKVVIFCGGLGLRLREYSDRIPKPMVEIGYRPLLWHVMKYYASYGHKDFILCLGYRGDIIKRYFLEYNECTSNDFVLSGGGKNLQLLGSDIEDWRITFVDTGLHSNIGQRLKAVEKHLEEEEVFLANYSDGLSDVPLDKMLEDFYRHNKVGCFVSVQPTQSFHVVSIKEEMMVDEIKHLSKAGIWINGGFFIFKKDIFNYIQGGEELVEEPFRKLIGKGQLISYKYNGFWVAMDTFKDKQLLDDMYAKGNALWEIWKKNNRIEHVMTSGKG
jgi:glucose-1-phosphate cytidylyltransferase